VDRATLRRFADVEVAREEALRQHLMEGRA
jgi:hypothetical protein